MSLVAFTQHNLNDSQGSKDSDTLRDEIGDESIKDRNESESSSEDNNSVESPEGKSGNDAEYLKISTQVCKSARLMKEEEEAPNYLHLPTANYQRRASIFDSLIGGFGSAEFNKNDRQSKMTMLGDTSSKI